MQGPRVDADNMLIDNLLHPTDEEQHAHQDMTNLDVRQLDNSMEMQSCEEVQPQAEEELCTVHHVHETARAVDGQAVGFPVCCVLSVVWIFN